MAAEVEIAIDGHVHLVPAVPVTSILQAAAKNFARWSGVASKTGVLMLTESAGIEVYRDIRKAAESSVSGLSAGSEPELVEAEFGGWRLLIVAGRQIVTRERVEVLALATCARFEDGKSIDDTLGELKASDALIVLPWAAGKWLGPRRKLIESLVDGEAAGGLLLGDNGGRPTFWRDPLLTSGGKRRLGVLAGSDPLPVSNPADRIGTFGSLVHADVSASNPVQALKAALRGGSAKPRTFGKTASPTRFVREQIALRLARRSAGRAR